MIAHLPFSQSFPLSSLLPVQPLSHLIFWGFIIYYLVDVGDGMEVLFSINYSSAYRSATGRSWMG